MASLLFFAVAAVVVVILFVANLLSSQQLPRYWDESAELQRLGVGGCVEEYKPFTSTSGMKIAAQRGMAPCLSFRPSSSCFKRRTSCQPQVLPGNGLNHFYGTWGGCHIPRRATVAPKPLIITTQYYLYNVSYSICFLYSNMQEGYQSDWGVEVRGFPDYIQFGTRASAADRTSCNALFFNVVDFSILAHMVGWVNPHRKLSMQIAPHYVGVFI